MPSRAARASLALAGWLAAALALTGCTESGATAQPSPTGATATRPLAVSASFYPLEYALTAVGGPHVTVTTLTKPGVEPHDLELTPSDVGGLRSAALVVYLAGLQPAVDTAVAQQASGTGFDVSAAASLVLPASGSAPTSEDAGRDLHFWLDPQRLAAVGTAVAERLAQLDPAHAGDYRTNAAALAADLGGLDTAYREGLATCANRHLVTSHAAFGYLARRYGFTQVPISGVQPEQEPSARALADVANVVRETQTTTIYSETLVDAKYAETIASSTGAALAVLDPVEGITSRSAGSTYVEIMRANLATLRTGQGCT